MIGDDSIEGYIPLLKLQFLLRRIVTGESEAEVHLLMKEGS
jgi:hypothetical protein